MEGMALLAPSFFLRDRGFKTKIWATLAGVTHSLSLAVWNPVWATTAPGPEVLCLSLRYFAATSCYKTLWFTALPIRRHAWR